MAVLSQAQGCEWRIGLPILLSEFLLQTLFIGKSYVVFGRVGIGTMVPFALSSLNGTNGFVLNGKAAGDRTGFRLRAQEM